MANKRKRKRPRPNRSVRERLRAPFSAFIWGVLLAVGINPGQLLIETALHELEIYFQLAAVGLLMVLLYYTFGDIVEGVRRSRKAYRNAGLLGTARLPSWRSWAVCWR